MPGSAGFIKQLMKEAAALDFIRDQYHHAKTLMLMGDAHKLLQAAGIELGEAPVPGITLCDKPGGEATAQFIEQLSQHRHFERLPAEA